MSLTRALAWNTGTQLAGELVSTALGIVVVGMMTRLLGQAGFGACSTANAFLQVFALLLDLGLNVTLIALLGEHAGDEAYEKRCVSAFFTLRLVSGLIFFLGLAPLIAFLSPYPLPIKLAIIGLIGSFFFPTLTQIITGVQQRHLKMHIAAGGEIAGRIVLLAGLVIARSLDLGLVPIMGFISIASVANFIVNLLFTRRYAHFHWNWDPAFWKQALSRSWPIGVSIAFGLIYFKADTLILSLVRSQAEVGIYGAAYRILEILITLPFMYAGLVLPILSHAWVKGDRDYFSLLVRRSIDVMMMVITPLIIATWLLGEKIVTLVAGKDFTASAGVLNILIIAVGVIYLNTIFSHVIVALNAQRKMLPIYILVAIVTLIGYLLFIPTYGLWAAAWLTVFSETCVGLGSLLVSHRIAPIPFHPKTSVLAIVSAAVMGMCVWYVRDSWLPIPIITGIVAYLALIFLTGAIPKGTLRQIFSLTKSKKTAIL